MERVRTIKSVVDYYKEHDPETGISEYLLRTLIQKGRIPARKNGRKYFVTLEAVEAYFKGINLSKQAYAEHKEQAGNKKRNFTPIV